MSENKELQAVVDKIQRIIERRYNKLQVDEALDVLDSILENTDDLVLFECIQKYLQKNNDKMNIFDCKAYLQGACDIVLKYKIK